MTDASKTGYYVSTNEISSITLVSLKPEEIIFDCSLQSNKSIITNLDIKNKGKGYVAFKIKTTVPKNYLVRPSIGYLAPNESASIEITVLTNLTSNIQLINNDKFLIMCAEAGNNTEPIEKFWKNIHPTQIQQQKLKVSVANFNSESTPRENNPTNEKVSSEKIAKTLEGERSYQAFKSVINTGGYENETFKSTFEKSNIREINAKSQYEPQKNQNLNSSANNIGDSNEKGKFESDYQKKYEEILDKVDQQEKLLNKLNQDRSRLVKELSQYKNTTFKHSNAGDKETQFGFQLWHVLLAAAISLLVGALLSSK